jgi:hypothetical protein
MRRTVGGVTSALDDRRDDRDLERDSWKMGPKVDVADSGLREADLQEVPLGLQMGDALELDPELAALRGRELLDLADPALERRYYGPPGAGRSGAADLTRYANACYSPDCD